MFLWNLRYIFSHQKLFFLECSKEQQLFETSVLDLYDLIVFLSSRWLKYYSESESEWALLARYVYTFEEFVIVTKLHSATEWQQQDRTQTTK